MFGLGPSELIVIAIIVLLIFGAKRLPEIGKGLGGAIKEFKNIKKDISLEETAGEKKEAEEKTSEKTDSASSIEAKVAGKVLDQVPGIKKVMDVKKKAEKVKKLLD